MELIAIEGNSQKLDGGAMYGNAPRELWKRWSTPDETNRITLACRALLLKTDDGKNILFETGAGAFFDDAMKARYGIEGKHNLLIGNLEKVGISPDKIDTIILSHLHFDHLGGLVNAYGEGEPRLMFPNARFYVSSKQWERANNPHPRDKASYIRFINTLLEKSGRLVIVGKNDTDILGPAIEFIFSDGHTPGLMMSRIKLDSGPLLFVSDLIPAAPWVNPSLSMGYDRYPELLIDEKSAILQKMHDENGKLFFTHDPQIICGKVARDEKGKWTAMPVDLTSLS